jgi:hypothetical protein
VPSCASGISPASASFDLTPSVPEVSTIQQLWTASLAQSEPYKGRHVPWVLQHSKFLTTA